MRVLKRVLLGAGAVLALLILLLLLVPILFRGRIIERVKTGVSDAVAARVDWTDTRLSLFRDFPNLTLRLDSVSVAGVEQFAGDTLAAVARLRVVVDLGSVLRGLRKGEQIVIRSVDIERPVLRLLVLEDGTANWDIARPGGHTAQASGRGINLGLRRLTIDDARITFDNRRAGVTAALTGLHHSLSGDFTRDRSTLRTRTRVDSTTVAFAGMNYLNRAALDIRADIDADLANGSFTFRENEVRLNELLLAFDGTVARAGEDLRLDVKFSAPQTDVKQILSLVPAIYLRDFAALQASGQLTVDGTVDGLYGATAFPAFSLNARVQDGGFQYPDLPLPARDIALELAIVNPGHHVDSTVVDLRRFRMQLGTDPIDAMLVLRTPVSDPDVDVRLNGRVDLANITRTIKLDSVQQLTGIAAANLAMRARRSALTSREYDRVSASGEASLRDVAVRAAGLPHAITVDELQLRFTPRQAELSSLRGRVGSSDFQLTGALENLLGFVLHDEDLRGRAELRSERFVLDEWRSERTDRTVIPVPPRLDVTFAANIAQLTYGKLQFANARGSVRVKDQRVTLDDFRTSTLGGHLGMSGFYETTQTQPTFAFKFAVDSVDIPGAFTAIQTVQKFAPVAQYASGKVSAQLNLNGTLGGDMLPLFEVLNGEGSFLTSRVMLQGFPVLHGIADQLKLQQLRDPAVSGIRSSIAIHDGRLHVKPFDVSIGESRLRVSGSNGIDQSLLYTVSLAVPRSMLGSEADRVVNSLITQTGRAGIVLQPSDVIELGVQLTGTVTNPAIKTDFGGVVGSAAAGLQQSVQQALENRVNAVEQQVDSAREAARLKAQAEAERIVREAEARAETIRAEARQLADNVRAEGNRQADELLARATTPLARAAARPAADRLRREAESRAAQIVAEADRRADSLVAEARDKAALISGG